MIEALLVIDMQEYFYSLKPKAFNTKIIPNLHMKLDEFRQKNKLIIHAFTVYSQNKQDWPKVRKKENSIWCIAGSGEERFIPGFEPKEDEVQVIKKRYSAFFNTELHQILTDKNVEVLMLCGFSTDVCIRMTANDAYNYGYKNFFLKDCMDSLNESNNASLEYNSWIFNADCK